MQDQQDEKRSGADAGEQIQENALRIFQLIEDVLYQGKDVVQRPVKDQARRRIVQQDQEHGRHAVHLDLASQRESLHVDRGGNDVDRRHQDRKKVDRKAADPDQLIRRAEIADGSERDPLQRSKIGKKMIGCDEERDLEQERDRSLQYVRLLVSDLPVVRRQHHEPFVALERLLDVVDPRLHPDRLIALLRLHRVGAAVQRQNQEVHRQAQKDNDKPRIADHVACQSENDLKQQFQRPDHQLIQRMPNRHSHFSPLTFSCRIRAVRGGLCCCKPFPSYRQRRMRECCRIRENRCETRRFASNRGCSFR